MWLKSVKDILKTFVFIWYICILENGMVIGSLVPNIYYSNNIN